MVTIKDIAKSAGVSVTTVSRALNGYDDVNEGTRLKIKTIADELGYSPNMAARSLISKKTKTLGLLLSNITRDSSKDNIAYEVLCGINDRSGELDYDLVLFSTTPQKQSIKSYKTLCQERGVDGVIIMGIRLDDPYLKEIVSSEIPCILIDITLQGPNVAYVTSDNTNGALAAVNHLLEYGHREIAMINGHTQADVSLLRLEGYRRALHQAGMVFDETLVLNGQFSEQGGKEAACRIMTERPEVTALFCASDLMALGALQGVKEMGKKVPDDISIIGFDNIDLTAYCTPALSTVHQYKYELGTAAAQVLIDLLEGKDVSHHVMLATDVIQRESVRRLEA
ncbi:LacI family DNA-binding transcriptional regulator [Paenibacillus radicis (ex Gao et al. 2016)]|uniref:LacI family transcriptional regulator n=1 Tax=Paenibacillus radicis (ex Gao et al. 2016) TaxID=1737354 RepID=A0A917M7W9_9BACL|nr:LacI family DNA-binding transcriptional regulator [Paenibacillus radicis (ex Gao et al. 2016)]GGG83152.1 LacI family transcriptional regulator [Paenibacillus radicis (ex Gao et al. 2016)]